MAWRSPERGFTNVVECIAVHVEVDGCRVRERGERAVCDLNKAPDEPVRGVCANRQAGREIVYLGARDEDGGRTILENREVETSSE